MVSTPPQRERRSAVVASPISSVAQLLYYTEMAITHYKYVLLKLKVNISSNQLPLCYKSVSDHYSTIEHREKYDRKIREEIVVLKLYEFC